MGIIPFNILKYCDFASCNDVYEYSFNATKLSELEKYYSYIFESECVFNACNVKITISNNEIDNINISLDFNTVMLEENVKITAVVNYSNN